MRPKRLVGVLNLAAVWVGRDELLDRLYVQLSKTGPKVMALVGQGGIGKTSLAAKLVEQCGVDLSRGRVLPECPYDGVLLLETKNQAGDLIAEIINGLGLDAEKIAPAQRVEAILQVLRQQVWLVVLDNLEDMLYPSDHEHVGSATVPEVGELLNGLVYKPHQSRVVLTSRELPRDLTEQRSQNSRVNPRLVFVEEVKGIDKQAGAELLRDLGVVDDVAKREEIALRVAGHAFVLTQLAAFAVSELDGNLYHYLQQHPALYTDDVSEILLVQMGRRTEAQRQLLKRMSVLRFLTEMQGLTFLRLYEDAWETDGRLITNHSSALRFSQAEQTETQNLIDELMRVCLVERVLEPINQVRQYRLHPVVTEFLQERFSAEMPALFQCTQAFYRRGGKALAQDLAMLVQQIQAPLSMAQHLGHSGELGFLVMQLMMRLKDNDIMPKLWETMSTQGVNEITVLLHQGELEYRFNNWDKAEVFFQKALRLAQAQNDRAKIAIAIGQLGSIELLRGNWDAAERLFRQCLQVEEELGNRLAVANIWAVLGDIERYRGNWDAAEQLYRQSFQLCKELGDRSGMATSIGCLGKNELGRDNLDAAEAYLKDALAQMQQLGMTASIGGTHWDLAQLEHKRHNPTAAQNHYTTAHRLYTQLGAAKDPAIPNSKCYEELTVLGVDSPSSIKSIKPCQLSNSKYLVRLQMS